MNHDYRVGQRIQFNSCSPGGKIKCMDMISEVGVCASYCVHRSPAREWYNAIVTRINEFSTTIGTAIEGNTTNLYHQKELGPTIAVGSNVRVPENPRIERMLSV